MANGNEQNSETDEHPQSGDERPLRWAPDSSEEQTRLSAPPPPGEGGGGETGEPPPEVEEPALPSWERLEEEGFFPALVLSLKEVLFEPGPTFARMPQVPDLGRPLLFLVLVGTFGACFTAVYGWIAQMVLPPEWIQTFMEQMFGSLPAEYETSEQVPLWFSQTCGQLCSVLIEPIVLVIFGFIGAGIVHLMLMLFGGANFGYEATFRTFCYVAGAVSIFKVIPFVGGLVRLVWGIVVLIIALTHTQKASAGQAVAAVLVPICFCCLCIAAVVILVLSVFFWGAGQTFGRPLF